MTPGSIVRRLIAGPMLRRVLEAYRSVFVDLDEVVRCIPLLPPEAEILDVGGGDGAVLDRILRRQAGLRASLVDPLPSVGVALEDETRARTRLFPSTSVRDCSSRGVPRPDVVMLTDVLHHVPADEREGLLKDIREFCGEHLTLLVVKDVAPVGWRARLGLLSDRYVTGDRHVTLLAPDEMGRLVSGVFPHLTARETPLLERDGPNYCWLFEHAGEGGGAQAGESRGTPASTTNAGEDLTGASATVTRSSERNSARHCAGVTVQAM